jgi:hypothetical protein
MLLSNNNICRRPYEAQSTWATGCFELSMSRRNNSTVSTPVTPRIYNNARARRRNGCTRPCLPPAAHYHSPRLARTLARTHALAPVPNLSKCPQAHFKSYAAVCRCTIRFSFEWSLRFLIASLALSTRSSRSDASGNHAKPLVPIPHPSLLSFFLLALHSVTNDSPISISGFACHRHVSSETRLIF